MTVGLPFGPPVRPMLARLTRTLPAGERYVFEPKWDGFRCLAFRAGAAVELVSRHERPLTRYFPEVVEALQALDAPAFVVDGELMIPAEAADFGALMARLHPAASRVERLRRETPARLAVFDVLALDGDDLREWPFERRRTVLERLLADAPPTLQLTPLTGDRTVAETWLHQPGPSGIDGVVAKHLDQPYEAGRRSMVKVKPEYTADCVVAGVRPAIGEPGVASLLLGLYDDTGALRHVGVVASFSAARRRELAVELEPYVTPLDGHPWEHGFLTGGGPTGRLAGAAGRWMPGEMALDWVPLAPERVCEVTYDQLDDRRFRHPGRFVRWRPDRDARSCLLEQLAAQAPDIERLLG